MKVLCVYSRTTYSLKKELHSPSDIPFGISYIATVLKKAGHDVELTVLTPTTNLQKRFEKIFDEFSPSLVCLTSVSSQMPLIRKAGRVIREISPSTFIILGGVHATLNPEETIALDFLDAICIGEGEDPILELASQLESGRWPSGVGNLWIKNRKDGTIEKNERLPFRTDLDGLPFIDRQMWEPYISNKKGQIYTVLAGRGCPNRCTYCSNHALAKVTTGKYVRFRSPENIIEEIKRLREFDPLAETIFLETETIGANLKYTYQLLDSMAEYNSTQKKPVRFGTNLALNPRIKNNRKLLEAFKRANVDFFRIGLESGSERIRREILNRPNYRNEDLIEFCRMARELDIKYTINILIGLPGETREDFQETVRVTRLCRPTYGVSVSIFYPYPGTKLHQLCLEQNLISRKVEDSVFERTATYLKLPGFSPWQVKLEFILFYYKVFRGYEPWPSIAIKTLRYAADAFPTTKYVISRLVHLVSKPFRRASN
ncbi:MAG: B12-binding domain-containing radical SAM protein [Thermodesulfobacteria bacterium]|nr:B12-binding domain-containing radical SAM protein [Thermodesulfobacteriota bacterium]